MNMLHLSDSELIASYITGNEASLEVLVNRHQAKVYNFIITRIRDTELANDIFQDAFVKVIQTLKKGSYNEEGKFLPWLLRISHNLIIDHYRREKRMPKYANSEDYDVFSTIKDEGLNVEGTMIVGQIESDLHKLIEYLPEEQKEVLMMRHFGDMSFKEIADATDVSINTALGRMRYALINLRKLVEKHNVILTR